MEQTKICTKCNEHKSIALFSVRRASRDGLAYKCKPCDNAARSKRHHETPFEVRQAYFKDYKEKNREIILQRNRDYYSRNKEAFAEYHRQHYLKNRERILATNRDWAARNPDYNDRRKKRNPEKWKLWRRNEYLNNKHRYNANRAHYEACRINATPKWANRKAMADIYRLCREMNKNSDIYYVVDHIVPLRSKLVCGLHCETNLQIIPAPENGSKSNKFDPDTVHYVLARFG